MPRGNRNSNRATSRRKVITANGNSDTQRSVGVDERQNPPSSPIRTRHSSQPSLRQQQRHSKNQHRVRFSPLDQQQNKRLFGKKGKAEEIRINYPCHPSELSEEERSHIWYTKKELKRSRNDLKQAIQFLRQQLDAGVDLYFVGGQNEVNGGEKDSLKLAPSDKNILSDNITATTVPCSSSKGSKDDNENYEKDDFCLRGCERYYDLEMRQMVQKSLIYAVLDAQKQSTRNKKCSTKNSNKSSSTSSNKDTNNTRHIREVSESLSQSCKDLAAWHAMLNAYHCWGAKVGLKTPASIPPHRRNKKHQNSTSPSSIIGSLVE